MPDQHRNFAVTTVATAPSPATSGTSLVLAAGTGTRFPATPFNASVWPANAQPDPTNAEIVRVTAIAGDTLTIARAQESTTARTIVAGDQVAASITAKTLTDVETVAGQRVSPHIFSDFHGNGSALAAPWHTAAISAGTTAILNGQPGHPGIIRATSSTTANSGQFFGSQNASALLLSAGDYFEAIFRLGTATGLTLRLGFHDTQTSADAVDGAYFEIASTGVATFKTASNSVRTSAATTATLTASTTWFRAEIEVRSATDVRGRIFNSDTGAVVLAEQTITTNIPMAVNRECAVTVTATNSGTTASALIDLDWLAYGRMPGFDLVR